MFDEAFAGIAAAFTTDDGPFHEAEAVWPGVPVMDEGGSIVDPGAPIKQRCTVQFDAATLAMRQAEGFRETDVRLIVLGLDELDISAVVKIAAGSRAGTWALQSCQRDPAAVGWECRARRS